MGNSCGHDLEESEDEELLKKQVTLHIYDVGHNTKVQMVNQVLHAIGTGLFHAAVEVDGLEWSYGHSRGPGIFSNKPRGCKAHGYRESLPMGETSLSSEEVQSVLEEMKPLWPGTEYELLTHNCTHFARAFCMRLGVKRVPSWVTSLASAGATVQGGTVMIKNVLQAPLVIAAAKAGRIEQGVLDIVQAGEAANGPTRHQTQLGNFATGLAVVGQARAIVVGKNIEGVAHQGSAASHRENYRLGDFTRGLAVIGQARFEGVSHHSQHRENSRLGDFNRGLAVIGQEAREREAEEARGEGEADLEEEVAVSPVKRAASNAADWAKGGAMFVSLAGLSRAKSRAVSKLSHDAEARNQQAGGVP